MARVKEVENQERDAPDTSTGTVPPRRIKLVVAYDGTDFSGWATQSGRRTVQTTLIEAIHRVSGEQVELIGASRTDSGAHAKGQVCHFDSTVNIAPKRWERILNNVMEPDLAIVSSEQVSNDFHSRFSVLDRFYRYRIQTAPRDPLRSRFTHSYGRPLDLQAMQEAAKALVGRHDFRSFTEELDPTVENTWRELYKVEVKQVRDEIWIDITGTAFLRGMMRRISGALLEIGRSYRPITDIHHHLTPKAHNLQLPIVLPAKGLCLMQVRYGKRPRDNRSKG
ncbi:MAG: tRNA pseudouridine(38-40) synthase TruA [Fimbriimonas sp.]